MSKSENYQIKEYIRGGSAGTVYKGKRESDKVDVAIKKINLNFFNEHTLKRIFREICILTHLNSRYNIFLMDLYAEIENDKIFEVYLVLPLMDYDLHKVMNSNNNKLRYFQIIKIMYQLIMGLKYLFKCGIIHRDLKPSNIGLNSNLDVRILDFGLARDVNDSLTEYVVTRWYRPLEIFCTSHYTMAVDMWSLGCIFVELFTHKVLFQGKDQIDQIIRILSIMSFPDEEMISEFNSNEAIALNLFRDHASKSILLENLIRSEVEYLLKNDEDANPQSCDEVMRLISQMLEMNPRKRINPIEAQKSPIFLDHLSDIACYKEDDDPHLFHCIGDEDSKSNEFWEEHILDKIESFIPRTNKLSGE